MRRALFLTGLLLAAIAAGCGGGGAVGTARAEAAEPPGGRLPPEAAAVLQRFVGNFRTHVIIRRQGSVLESHGFAEGRWTMEGRFVEFRSRTDPPGESDLQVMTWDEEARVFRQWLFDSSGYRHEASGQWIPATTTLHWEGSGDGTTFVIPDRFMPDGRLEWSLTRRNGAGQVVQEIEGTVTPVD